MEIDYYNSILLQKEKEIAKDVNLLQLLQQKFEVIKESLQNRSEDLKKNVNEYKELRRMHQRIIWEQESIGWCQKCNKKCNSSEICLIYTREIEENDKYVRRILAVCKNCAINIFNKPRLGEDQFECFNAKIDNGVFYIFKEKEWQKIYYMKNVIVQIERDHIPEKDFQIGKDIEFYDYPKLVFKVNGKDIFAKPADVKDLESKPARTESSGETKEER